MNDALDRFLTADERAAVRAPIDVAYIAPNFFALERA